MAGRAAKASRGDDSDERDDRDPDNHRLSDERTNTAPPIGRGRFLNPKGSSRSPFPRPTLRRLPESSTPHPSVKRSSRPLPASQSRIASRPRRELKKVLQIPRRLASGSASSWSVRLGRQTSSATVNSEPRPRRGGFFHDGSSVNTSAGRRGERGCPIAATSATGDRSPAKAYTGFNAVRNDDHAPHWAIAHSRRPFPPPS